MNIKDTGGDTYSIDLSPTNLKRLNDYNETKGTNIDRWTKTWRVHGLITPNSIEKGDIERLLQEAFLGCVLY